MTTSSNGAGRGSDPRRKFRVLRDTREKENHGWWFGGAEWCLGTAEAPLRTGDYCLEGLEETLVVDRKRDPKELAQNVFDPRFEDVLARLSVGFEWAAVVCEFPYARIPSYPEGSGIPAARWRAVRVTGALLVRRFTELQLDYPRVHWQFCDDRDAAARYVRSLFKRRVERYWAAAD